MEDNRHRFYGQFEPPVDKYIFERYFPDTHIKGIFVECGAFDGQTESSCKFFEETMGWKGYNIEPVPWVYDNLCKNRPHSINLNFALSNMAGDAVFKAVDHPVFGRDCTNGSLDHTESHKKWLDDIGCKIVEVPVKLKTWSDFVESENINYVDLLVLDVEGHEISVLNGMVGCPILPDVICIEVGHLDFHVIRLKLSEMGYVYDSSSNVNAFFVKAFMIPTFIMRRCQFANDRIVKIEQFIEQNKRIESAASNSVLQRIAKMLRNLR